MKKDIEKQIGEDIQKQRVFHSPTHGQLTFKEVIYWIGNFMHQDEKANYQIVFGTDSQTYSGRVDFVSAIIVYRIGSGGIFFWQRQREEKKYVLRDRMYQEAILSMELAQNFMEQFKIEGITRFNLEIHVDIGEKGETRTIINEVVGMIRGSGFTVKTKPDAYGAASVADRYT